MQHNRAPSIQFGVGLIQAERLESLSGALVTPTAGLEVVRFHGGKRSSTVFALLGHHSGVCAPVWNLRGGVLCAMDDALLCVDMDTSVHRYVCRFRKSERPAWMTVRADGNEVLLLLSSRRAHERTSHFDRIDVTSGRRRSILDRIELNERVWACAAAADGGIFFSVVRHIYEGEYPTTTLYWLDPELLSVKELGPIPVHGRLRSCLNGRLLLADAGQKAWIIDIATMRTHAIPLQSASLSPTGDLIAGAVDTRTLAVVEARGGTPRVLARAVAPRVTRSVLCHVPSWSEDGRYIAVSVAASPMRAWNFIFDLQTNQVLREAGAWRLPVWSPGSGGV